MRMALSTFGDDTIKWGRFVELTVYSFIRTIIMSGLKDFGLFILSYS